MDKDLVLYSLDGFDRVLPIELDMDLISCARRSTSLYRRLSSLVLLNIKLINLHIYIQCMKTYYLTLNNNPKSKILLFFL